MQYVQIKPAGDLPRFPDRPYKAIVIVECAMAAARRETICHWLLDSGCLYLMAWGDDCEPWVAVIEQVNRAAHQTDEIPDECLVIATAHADETLEQVFWFAKYTAMHPCADLRNIVIVHVAEQSCEQQFLEALQQA